MALTNTSSNFTPGVPSAAVRAIEIIADLDNSYPTGGYDISALLDAQGVQTIKVAPFVPASDGTTLRYLRINPSTKKLMVFVTTTMVEVAAAVDLSTYDQVRVHCFCE